MPFDGNPHKAMGLIAHPGEVSSLTISGDGNYLLTAGGTDLTVNVWKINTQALQARRALFLDKFRGGGGESTPGAMLHPPQGGHANSPVRKDMSITEVNTTANGLSPGSTDWSRSEYAFARF